MQAAHGWLEQEAQGEAADGKMNDSVKLAFPEWVSLLSDVCVFLCHVVCVIGQSSCCGHANCCGV
jgi:hypothetical protein